MTTIKQNLMSVLLEDGLSVAEVEAIIELAVQMDFAVMGDVDLPMNPLTFEQLLNAVRVRWQQAVALSEAKSKYIASQKLTQDLIESQHTMREWFTDHLRA